MRKPQGLLDTYFRFVNLVQAVEELPTLPKLDAGEERLLRMLTAAWHSGRSLSVTEAMSLEAAGAPATVHRKLAKLRKDGLIDFEPKMNEPRSKAIVPTARTLQYFEALAICLHKAGENP